MRFSDWGTQRRLSGPSTKPVAGDSDSGGVTFYTTARTIRPSEQMAVSFTRVGLLPGEIDAYY